MKRFAARGTLAGLLLLLAPLTHAQLFRAYLASYGNDANPCTVGQPCRLLPAALNAVADKGEVWILDSANYNQGMVNITKSVTIQAIPGQVASIVAVGGNGAINIDTAGVRVVLRNLVISNNANNPGTGGIYVIHADSVTIENSVLAGFPSSALNAFNAQSHIFIADTVIRDSGMWGITLNNGPTLTMTRSRLQGNASGGITVSCTAGSAIAHVSDTVISGSNQVGVGVALTASSNNCSALAYLTRVTIADMADGLYVESANAGTTAIAQLTSSTVAGNTGHGYVIMAPNFTGRVESLGNNNISDNAAGDVGTLDHVAQR